MTKIYTFTNIYKIIQYFTKNMLKFVSIHFTNMLVIKKHSKGDLYEKIHRFIFISSFTNNCLYAGKRSSIL